MQKLACFTVFCAFSLLVCFSASAQAEYSWVTQEVSDYVWNSGNTPIVVDSNGTAHIAYTTLGLECASITYASRNSSTWIKQGVEIGYTGIALDLALDSKENPAVLFTGGVSVWNGSDWNAHFFNEVVKSPAFAFDSSDGLHVVYYVDNSSEKILKYATWSGERWVVQKISAETAAVSIRSMSLAIDKNDKPYVLYRVSTESSNDIKLATIQKTRWVINEVPLQAKEVDNCGNIVCDSQGAVHFVCLERYIKGDAYTYRILYLSYSGDAWDKENLVSDVYLDAFGNLVLDKNDNSHFTYSVNAQGKYATCQGGNWHIVSLPADVKAGSLAVDKSGNLHLSMRMNSVGAHFTNLYYATNLTKLAISSDPTNLSGPNNLSDPNNLTVIGSTIIIVLVIITLSVWHRKSTSKNTTNT
jgi:hypothetical protein